MQEKLFLVNKSTAYSIERLKKKSVAELTTIADYVLSSFNSLAILATEGLINLADYHLVPKQVQEDEHHFRIGRRDDWLEIVINNELQLHVSTNGGEGYDIDLYAYNADISDDDRVWEEEYITSAYANYKTIKDMITARENN